MIILGLKMSIYTVVVIALFVGLIAFLMCYEAYTAWQNREAEKKKVEIPEEEKKAVPPPPDTYFPPPMM